MNAKFYEITERLDELKSLEFIEPTEISELIEYLAEEKYARYFFMDLKNLTWALPLYEKGIFFRIPPPLEDPANPGYFSMPIWHGGEYLKRIADKIPDVVKDVALSLETQNSRAIKTMFEALRKVPVDITAQTVTVYRRWVETPFANFMILSDELGLTMEYLAKGGQVEASLNILEVLLEPVQMKDRFDDTKIIAGSRHDSYWLNQAIRQNLPVLTDINPIGVVRIAQKQLINAIDLERDPKIDQEARKLKSFWRLSIDPRSDESPERDLKNLLVNTIIVALDKACEQKKDEASMILDKYLDGEYSILERIGIYMLRTWGNQYPDLIEQAYRRLADGQMDRFKSEFRRFVDAQFGNLPEFTQAEILRRIRVGPEPELVASLLKQQPDAFEGDTEDARRQTLIEKWLLRELNRFESHLKGEDRELYTELVEKYEKPSPPLEEGVVITSWGGPESPIEVDELAKKTVFEVIQYLLDFAPSSDRYYDTPSREGLGRTLETDVQNRATDYADNAILFINENLRFVYHAYFFRGLENAVKNGWKPELTHVIALAESIAAQVTDKFEKQQFEEGLPSAKLAILQLLERLFREKEPYIEEDLLARSGQLMVNLLNQEEPFPDNEEASGYDPATHSLNCIHGVAMHSMILYGLYCERKRQKEKGGEKSSTMIPLVKETLTGQLDKTKDASLAVHSVLGWYFPQLMYLDTVWAMENREKIFPPGPGMVRYWEAAWKAYILFSDVYTDVFPKLLNEYRRAIEEFFAPEKPQDIGRSNEKIASHILKAYLLDMVRLDSGDGLLPLFYQKADDQTRSHGNLWLSQVLDAQKPSAQDKVWQKIWDLWQWRIKQATASDVKSEFAKEISSFSRFLKNVPLDLSEVHIVIQQALDFKTDGFESQETIEYLGMNCEKYPDLAVSLLYKIVISNPTLYLLAEARDHVNKILTSAIDAGGESGTKAIELINIFGERGDYSWRPLLDRTGA